MLGDTSPQTLRYVSHNYNSSSTRARYSFVQYILANLPQFPQQYIDIKRVNIGLLTPNEREASTLELGRNICALSEAYDQ